MHAMHRASPPRQLAPSPLTAYLAQPVLIFLRSVRGAWVSVREGRTPKVQPWKQAAASWVLQPGLVALLVPATYVHANSHCCSARCCCPSFQYSAASAARMSTLPGALRAIRSICACDNNNNYYYHYT